MGKKALIMQGRNSSARLLKRAGRQTHKVKTYLGWVTRDIERKVANNDDLLLN